MSILTVKGKRYFLPLVISFLIITATCLLLKDWLRTIKIDPTVLIAANALLFLLSAITTYMHLKAINNVNPHVFVRSVMGSSFIKLFIIGSSAVVYLALAKESRNVYAVIFSMVFYIFYTVIEVQGAFRLNKTKNGIGS